MEYQQFPTYSKHFTTLNRLGRIQVSAPTGGGWFSPEEAATALTSPPPPQETVSSPPSSSPAEPLPLSAVDVVLTLMRCNPCEVLGSLSPGIGVDGRIALIGRANRSGPGPTYAVGATRGGYDNDVGGGYDSGENALRGRHHRGGGETAIRREDRVDGGATGFRCSVEVAWDKDEGGVFVRRFGMESDEKRPRLVCRHKLPSGCVHNLLRGACKSCEELPRPCLDVHARQP